MFSFCGAAAAAVRFHFFPRGEENYCRKMLDAGQERINENWTEKESLKCCCGIERGTRVKGCFCF